MNHLEDSHYQVYIGKHDLDIVLRTNDEGTEHTSWDLIDYENGQECIYTCYDIGIAQWLIRLGCPLWYPNQSVPSRYQSARDL